MNAEQPPTRMLVSFGLFDDDVLLHKGTLLIKAAKGLSVYGEHKHFELPVVATGLELFSGLVIEHQFELPACPVGIQFFDVVPTEDLQEPFKQVRHFNAALRMGVHQSDDWESVQLDRFTFGFKCRPLP
jgi:hypothetical protein